MDNEIDSDEIIARELQAQFDAEIADGSLAHSAVAARHTISDSDATASEDEIERLMASKPSRVGGKSKSRSDVVPSHESSSTWSGAKKPRTDNTEIDENDEKSSKSMKPLCQYGSKCYRKNEEHRKQFRHDELAESSSRPVSQRQGQSDGQIRRVGSDQFYLTTVSGLRPQHNHRTLAIGIRDILADPIGNLKSSAQFNYMFEVDWLVEQYPAEHRKKPLLLVHGERQQAKRSLEKQASSYGHVRLCQAPLPDAFGTHHTKMMMLLYDQGLRIVVHTANLIRGDWHQKTQGVWVSPLFPSKGNADDDSRTHLKRDLLAYLACYYSCKDVDAWATIVRAHDFSLAKVCLVASTPGRHSGERKNLFGHLKLRSILKGPDGPDGSVVDHNWPVVGQFSSIGSLGTDANGWLCGEWLDSFNSTVKPSAVRSTPPLKLVFPSVDNVRISLEGYPAGASLPYSKENEAKQPWLRRFLHQWRSEAHGRTPASPHVKSYLRTSPDQSKIAWLLITSANLSKAAWGNLEKQESQVHIRSYELGVLLLPSNFRGSLHGGETVFRVDDVLVPFDLPVTPYVAKDRPWTWNAAHTDKPDRHGNVWQPS